MKYVKMLGLAAVAALALMAFVGAGTASATTLCKTNVSPCPTSWDWPSGTEIHATLKAGTSAILETTGGILRVTCTESTVHGKTNETSGTPLKGNVDTLSFGSCNSTTDVLDQTGTLEIEATSGGNGSVTGTSFEVTTTILSESCIYGLGLGTNVGTFTGGNPATLTANAVLSVLPGSAANCPTTTRWTATYTVTSPTGTIDATA